MIKLLLLLTEIASAEPGVCLPLPECDLAETPDEETEIQCSPNDVERCLILERRNCSYFVKLHGEVVAGGTYGYVSRPQVQTDEFVRGWSVIGNVHGALEVVTSNVQSPEVYPISDFHTVSGGRIHVSKDNQHYAFVAMHDGHLALNADGTWRRIPSHEGLYNLRFSDWQALLDYQTSDAEILTLAVPLRPITTVSTR